MQEHRGLVCVVDDDEDVRDSLRLLLDAHGMGVQTYESAEAFLAAPNARSPCCLVLDVHLPGMSGLDLLERLGASGPPPPTIMVSGRAGEGVAERAMALGAADFVHKPLCDQALLARIDRVLDLY